MPDIYKRRNTDGKKYSPKIFATVLILCVAASLLSACNKLPKLDLVTTDRYLDKKTDITYIPAPGCFEPVSIGEDYRRIDNDVLKKIGGLDPEKWLCDEKYKNVFYSSDITLPTFEEMTVREIKLCYEDVYIIEFDTITDPEEIAKVKDVYLHGETGVGFATTPEKVISLKFVFDECPGIYYSLVYSCNLETGEAYLTNRDEKKIIKADRLFDKYFESPAGE